MIAGLAAALLLVQAAPVQWERLGEEPVGVAYLDTASIRHEGGLVLFDMRIDFRDPEAIGAHSTIMATYVDCRRRLSGFTRIRGFDAEGDLIVDRQLADDDPDGRAQPMDMNAEGDIALDRRLCGRRA